MQASKQVHVHKYSINKLLFCSYIWQTGQILFSNIVSSPVSPGILLSCSFNRQGVVSSGTGGELAGSVKDPSATTPTAPTAAPDAFLFVLLPIVIEPPLVPEALALPEPSTLTMDLALPFHWGA